MEIIATSAGVIPLIRAAWPSETGRTAASFWRVSDRKPATSAIIEAIRDHWLVPALDLAILLRLPSAYPSYLRSVSTNSQISLGMAGEYLVANLPNRKSGRLSSCADRFALQFGFGGHSPGARQMRRIFSWNAPTAVVSTSPTRYASGVNRWSALSWRSCKRFSARLVNIRYGSSVPLRHQIVDQARRCKLRSDPG